MTSDIDAYLSMAAQFAADAAATSATTAGAGEPAPHDEKEPAA